MSKTVRSILLVVLAAVLLFAIGMVTRVPAMHLGINYGLHAVLAAFFYGVVVSAFELKTCHAYHVVVGAIVVGAVLGMMSPVMAVAEVLPALGYLVVYLVMRGCGSAQGEDGSRSAVVGGTVFAALAYVGTILGGMMFSGYMPHLTDVPFLLLSVGLGLLGSVAGSWLAGKLGR